jgi:hypothetical protein
VPTAFAREDYPPGYGILPKGKDFFLQANDQHIHFTKRLQSLGE